MVSPLSGQDDDITSGNIPAGADGIQETTANKEDQKIKERVAVSGDWQANQSQQTALNEIAESLEASSDVSTTTKTQSTYQAALSDNDIYQQQMTIAQTAYQEFLTAATAQDAELALNKMKVALAEANRAAQNLTTTEQQAVAAMQAKSVNLETVMQSINTMQGLTSNNEALLSEIKTTSSIDTVRDNMTQASTNAAQAEELYNQMVALLDPEAVPPALTAEKDRVDESANSVNTLGNAIKMSYDMEQSLANSVASAEKVGSLEAITNAKDAANATLAQAEEALALAPNSPIALAAKQSAEDALVKLKALENVYDDTVGGDLAVGGGGPSTGPFGGVSGNSHQTAMSLHGIDSGVTTILMDGFRNMIDQFEKDNPSFKQEATSMHEALQETVDQMIEKGVTEGLERLEELKELLRMMGNPGDLSATMGQITTQAAQNNGVSQQVSVQTGNNVRSIVESARRPSVKNMDEGRQSYQDLKSSYPNLDSNTKTLVDRSVSSALNRPIDTSKINTNGNPMMKAVMDNTNNLGELYGVLDAIDKVGQSKESNPDMDVRSLVAQFTKSTSQPTGYPFSQLPEEAAQKFLKKLETEFVEGTQELIESAMLTFDKRTQFIQDVLIAIASLYA